MTRDPQRGSAIIMLFVAIALFGLLGYAFLQGTRGSTTIITDTASKAQATDAMQCNNSIAMAVKRLEVRGCGNMISYISDGSNDHANAPTDGSCSVFHPNGGGVKVCDLSIAVGPNPCKASIAPAFGTICNDGSLYMGTTPDGGGRYAAAAADESGTFSWGPNFTTTSITSTNTGQANTIILVNLGAGLYRAAEVCFNKIAHGHDDWYLPAYNELDPMENSGNYLSGIDPAGQYWSSSEASNNTARALVVSTGNSANRAKNVSVKIRCVRKL